MAQAAAAGETEKKILVNQLDEYEADKDVGVEEEKPMTEEEQKVAHRRSLIDSYNQRKVQKALEEQKIKEEEDRVRPLEVSEAHENFFLDKKIEVDPTVGLPNNKHIICQFCEVIIIPESQATKVSLDVNLIQNSLREYDLCDTCWVVDDLTKFQNVEVHQLDDHVKYLCCLSCQSHIVGYIVREVSVKLVVDGKAKQS